MNPKLTTLKLFLETLGTNTRIDKLDDRKRVQKTIYLGQLTGVDLGYRFGWYLYGPYSPELTRDYYSLATLHNDPTPEQWKLNDNVKERLQQILPLMEPPVNLKSVLTIEDWLELVASYHYLRSISRLPHEQVDQEFLNARKQRLIPYVNDARAALIGVHLLSD